MKLVIASLAILLPAQLFGADESKIAIANSAVVRELKRYGHDFKEMAVAPTRWTPAQWARLGEGVAAGGAVYAADEHLYNAFQRNRSELTDDFAKIVTPFGGRRALNISALLIVGGIWLRNDSMRDGGRDSLESEIWAGGVVTPLLKRGFGRARPIQDEGARSFHPFSSAHQSFPSGHATNAFAFATAIAAHDDDWRVPALVYTIASGIALSRVNDRAHFPSDVLAGALIGRAVAKGVVYRHRHGQTAWNLAPALFDGRPGVAFRITRR